MRLQRNPCDEKYDKLGVAHFIPPVHFCGLVRRTKKCSSTRWQEFNVHGSDTERGFTNPVGPELSMGWSNDASWMTARTHRSMTI